MIEAKIEIIVRCPICKHRAFDVEILEGIEPNYTIEVQCRRCKGMFKFPDDDVIRVKKMIRENS